MLHIAHCAFDIGKLATCKSPQLALECLAAELGRAIATGAEVILLPEYIFGAFAGFFAEASQLRDTSAYVWQTALPYLLGSLKLERCFIVMGTTPYFDDSSQAIFNRAPIFNCGRLEWVDKVNLTPWESELARGQQFKVFNFTVAGSTYKVVPIICLDIELPSTAVFLHQEKPDVVLVAAATESGLGVERIARCASARAVECGAAVITAHLRCPANIGAEMFSDHRGGVGVYYPAQSSFADIDRQWRSATADDGHEWHSAIIDVELLRAQKLMRQETNPAMVGRRSRDP